MVCVPAIPNHAAPGNVQGSAIKICLVDNGSVRAHAALFTRALARKLGDCIGLEVTACSLDYSHRIDPGLLRGKPVPLLLSLLRSWAADPGCRGVWVLPLLWVNGGAIHARLAEQLQTAQALRPDIVWQLCPAVAGSTEGGIEEVVRMLRWAVEAGFERCPQQAPTLLLVDHGSPHRAAALLRDRVAARMEQVLEGRVRRVLPCSMERRPGPDYAFNEPLLADLLDALPVGPEAGPYWLLRFFLQPGKHSGKGGDIDRICHEALNRRPTLQLFHLCRVFRQKDLISLLMLRLREAAIGNLDASGDLTRSGSGVKVPTQPDGPGIVRGLLSKLN
jgi:hypothetical protein